MPASQHVGRRPFQMTCESLDVELIDSMFCHFITIPDPVVSDREYGLPAVVTGPPPEVADPAPRAPGQPEPGIVADAEGAFPPQHHAVIRARTVRTWQRNGPEFGLGGLVGERLVPLPELTIELPQALFVRLAGDNAAVLDPPLKDLEAAAMFCRVIQSEEHNAAGWGNNADSHGAPGCRPSADFPVHSQRAPIVRTTVREGVRGKSDPAKEAASEGRI